MLRIYLISRLDYKFNQLFLILILQLKPCNFTPLILHIVNSQKYNSTFKIHQRCNRFGQLFLLFGYFLIILYFCKWLIIKIFPIRRLKYLIRYKTSFATYKLFIFTYFIKLDCKPIQCGLLVYVIVTFLTFLVICYSFIYVVYAIATFFAFAYGLDYHVQDFVELLFFILLFVVAVWLGFRIIGIIFAECLQEIRRHFVRYSYYFVYNVMLLVQLLFGLAFISILYTNGLCNLTQNIHSHKKNQIRRMKSLQIIYYFIQIIYNLDMRLFLFFYMTCFYLFLFLLQLYFQFQYFLLILIRFLFLQLLYFILNLFQLLQLFLCIWLVHVLIIQQIFSQILYILYLLKQCLFIYFF